MRHTLIVGAIFIALLMWASEALAASQQLKGRYAVTGSNTCLGSPTGFDEKLHPKDGFYTTSGSILAIRTFNGDGTGSAVIRANGIVTSGGGVWSNLSPNASSSNGKLKFTYSIDADGFLTTKMVPGSFQGEVLEGPRKGQTFDYEGLSLKGLISGDKKVLTIATVDPEVSTIQYYDSNHTIPMGILMHEICNRSRVLTYIDDHINDDRENDGHEANH